MAKLGNATIEIGDFLRRDDNGVEGEVTEINDTNVTVRQWAGEVFTAPVAEFHYNTWDQKYEASAKSAPVLEPTDMP
jgi:hypothetical protein